MKVSSFFPFLAVAVVWTWPAAHLDPEVLVSRQFDLYPTVWLLARAHDVPLNLVHAESAWPVGELLARADSFVLLALGWLFGWIDARVLAASLTVLGPAVSAWAAERCAARAFGVPAPASWIAGLAYGFSGVAATAVLEGHVYHAFDPWLPLLLWAAVRANEGRWVHGVAAGAAWALALFTTAYAGIVGAMVLGAVVLRGVLARRFAGLAAGLVAVPAGLWYVSIYRVGGGFSDGHPSTSEQAWNAGTATLATLAGWSDAVDLRSHSVGAPLGLFTVGLCVVAPVVLRGKSHWRLLFLLAVLGVALALGRYIRVEAGGTAYWTPVSLLMQIPGVEVFRFPARFAWLWALCGGMVAARVFAELSRTRWLLWSGLILAFGQVFLGTGLPWRLRAQIGTVPSVYGAAEGAVLDLWPRPADRSSGELELWGRALGCYYQAFHRHPTLEVCLGTSVDSPRERVDRWLTTGLLRGDPGLVEGLQALGIGTVVLHAGLYGGADREALTEAMTLRLGEPARSSDGGERVASWHVPATAAEPRSAWERW